MSKLIVETSRRRCCKPQDFIPVKSIPHLDYCFTKVYKCKHCGDWWYKEDYTDAAGGSDTRWTRWFPREYTYEDIKKICGYGDLSY